MPSSPGMNACRTTRRGGRLAVADQKQVNSGQHRAGPDPIIAQSGRLVNRRVLAVHVHAQRDPLRRGAPQQDVNAECDTIAYFMHLREIFWHSQRQENGIRNYFGI